MSSPLEGYRVSKTPNGTSVKFLPEHMPDRSKVVLRHILERHAWKQPNEECAVFEDGVRWTYSDALRETYRAANALSGVGIKRDEKVLVFRLLRRHLSGPVLLVVWSARIKQAR